MLNGIEYFVIILCLILTNVDEVKNNTKIPIIILPDCTSNNDCSNRGECNISTNKCLCEKDFDTFIDNRIIENYPKINTILEHKTGKNSTDNVEFFNLYLTTEQMKFCNYQLKSQKTAFFLSLFVGFGSEHFYLERNSTGAAKFVFFTVCFGMNLLMFILYYCTKEGKKYVQFLSAYEAMYLGCGFILVILWNIYDLVHIGFGTYLDGNGFRMIPW
jgi:hypothetical protein